MDKSTSVTALDLPDPRGIAEDQAKSYVGAIYHALGTTAEVHAADGFDRLSVEYSTRGGLNEQAWRELKAAGLNDMVCETLDLIHDRVRGKVTLDDRLPRNR